MSNMAHRAQMYERRALEAVSASKRVHPVGQFLDKSNWHLQSKVRLSPVPTVLNTGASFAAWTNVPALPVADRHVWGGMNDVERPGKRQLKPQGGSAEFDCWGLVGAR
jgi:hypothetical protein